MKEGVTSKQLQLIDPFTDELIPNDKIPDMEPYVYDWIVSDPGETAEGADCYMDYNTYPTSTDPVSYTHLDVYKRQVQDAVTIFDGGQAVRDDEACSAF